MQSFKSTRKGLLTNFFSLSAVQFAGYIIPLISIPYLFRTIGTDNYGLFSLGAAFGIYIQVLLDYGFNISGIRDISKNRFDNEKLSHIVSGIMSSKLILLIISCLIATIAIFSIPRLYKDPIVYILLTVSAIGTSFLPSWFFQGIEKMKILAILNLSAKMVYLLLIFIFIRNPDDFVKLLYISIASSWTVAIIGIVIMIKQLRFHLNFVLGIQVIKTGFGVFTTQFWSNILQVSNIFILGLFVNNNEVGIYAVAEKIAKAAISIGIPFCSTVYPRSGILFEQSAVSAIKFLRKFMFTGGFFMAFVSILLFLLSPHAARLVVGHPAPEVSLLIRILSILPFTIFIDNIYGTQILFNINLEKEVIKIVTISAIVALLLLVTLTPSFGSIGTALSFVISESLVLILMIFSLWRLGVSPFLAVKNYSLLQKKKDASTYPS